jgi:hypothetical protein
LDAETRLALIRTVLATFEANSEADDGDRRLANPGDCIEAIASIADESEAAPGYTAMRDGWITTEAAPDAQGGMSQFGSLPVVADDAGDSWADEVWAEPEPDDFVQDRHADLDPNADEAND